MPPGIEVVAATPEEHRTFIARVPEFRLVAQATLCVSVNSAAMVNFESGRNRVGGACYILGAPIGAKAAKLHLFGVFPEHRTESLDKTALRALEKEIRDQGALALLVQPADLKSEAWYVQQGYVPVGRGYQMKALPAR